MLQPSARVVHESLSCLPDACSWFQYLHFKESRPVGMVMEIESLDNKCKESLQGEQCSRPTALPEATGRAPMVTAALRWIDASLWTRRSFRKGATSSWRRLGYIVDQHQTVFRLGPKAEVGETSVVLCFCFAGKTCLFHGYHPILSLDVCPFQSSKGVK